MIKFAVLSLVLVLTACGGGDAQQTGSAAGDAPVPAASPIDASAVASAVRSVKCGCAIAEVGRCGNYVEVDGTYLEISNGAELGLGSMEWCGRSGVEARVAGRVEGGRFLATELVVQTD